MGITGLIPFLEKASSKVQLKELRGSTVAVDTYCWLHKGVFSCAEKLVRGEDTDQYLIYCLKYVQLLLSYDIKPILVFDGRHLPAKALTERRRRESRQQSKKRAAELLRLGRTDEARSHMRRCVDVTHEMALRLIRECRNRNVDCIVAPYEADAQMAWLNKVDLAQYIITEDSDLTLFGARKVIFKLDLTGTGLLVEADKLYLAMGCRQEKYTFDKFRRMCILSGCDYLDSLPGIGLAKACKFMLKTEQEDMWIALKKIPQYLNMKNLEVDDEYIDNFLKAEATFRHMFIYNPLQRKMERLNALEDYQTDERHCCNAGTVLEDDNQAFQLALGNLNPFTLQKLDNWHPDKFLGFAQPTTAKNIKRAKHKSIWQANFQTHTSISTENARDVSGSKSSALFFKKVDFISKTIDEEITATRSAENAKPAEAEIFSMYKNGAYAMSPQMKRRRMSSSSSSSLNEATATPPASPNVNKTRYNPFAKPNANGTSEAICENSSLLKVLSPKRCNAEQRTTHIPMHTHKRTLFASETETQVEVKSRFFAANIKEITQMKNTPMPLPDLSTDIDEIEQLSQHNLEQLSQLYGSPSPKQEANTQSRVIEKLVTGVPAQDDIANDAIEKPTADNIVLPTVQTNANEKPQEIIDLSDDDSDCARNSTKTSDKTVQLAAFKSQIKTTTANATRRLGLTKPKTKSTKNPLKSIKATNTASLGQNQTRLSMFGFQKRPTLK